MKAAASTNARNGGASSPPERAVIQITDPIQGKNMARGPANLWRSRHGTYYFRLVVAPHIRKQAPELPLEFRRSLGFVSRQLALKLARRLRSILELRLDDVMAEKGY